jgi:phosphatidylinositol-3-phosphatase
MIRPRLAAIVPVCLIGLIGVIGLIAAASAARATSPAPATTTTCRTVIRVSHTTHLVWRRRTTRSPAHPRSMWVRVRVQVRKVTRVRVCATLTTAATTTTTTSTAEPTTTPSAPPPPATHYAHVVVVIEENYDGPSVVGNAAAPYLTSLAAQGEYLPNYHAVSHPSEPNYLALFTGSTQGQDGVDSCIVSSARSIAGEAVAAHVTVKGYVEGLGRTTGYACRHDAFSQLADARASVADFSSFPTDYATLPQLSVVVPNTTDDMHDQGIGPGDQWAKAQLDGYAQWAKSHASLLVIISDEHAADPNYATNQPGENGNTALAILEGAGIVPGTVVSTSFDHYAMLRTLEDIFGLGHLGASAGAAPIVAPTF